MSTRQQFPKINLDLQQARHLTYHYDVPRQDPEAAAWLPLLTDGSFLSAFAYSTAGKKHLLTVRVQEREGERPLFVSITYSQRRPDGEPKSVQPPRELRRIPDVVSVVSQFQIERHLICHVDFQIQEPPTAADLVFPLPLPFPSFPGTPDEDVPFDEIRGIRGVKLSTSGHPYDYRFIMDRPQNRSIHLTVDAHLDATVSFDTPMTVMAHMKSIRSVLGL